MELAPVCRVGQLAITAHSNELGDVVAQIQNRFGVHVQGVGPFSQTIHRVQATARKPPTPPQWIPSEVER
jgi:hypothetical protein